MYRYDNYFEEIIRKLNSKACLPPESYVYPNLMKRPLNVDHPLSVISEEACDLILKEMLTTNTAVYSSKYTHMYSRLGGADAEGTTEQNHMRRSVAVFPICANFGNLEKKHLSGKVISGFVFRGPNHTKNPTDRIPIIVVERFNKTRENRYLLDHMNKGMYYTGKRYYTLVRRTAIMKEDCAYLTFTNIALYNPINMLGLLTLENKTVSQGCNMMELVRNTISDSSQFFIDRFTEGVLMAAVGNPRDEGYFSCLRKILYTTVHELYFITLLLISRPW